MNKTSPAKQGLLGSEFILWSLKNDVCRRGKKKQHMHIFQRHAHVQRVENKRSQQSNPKSVLKEEDVNLSSRAGARTGSGLACMRHICCMENHPVPGLPVFLIHFSLQPFLTLGTMQLCAEGFLAGAAETVPFVMAWERENGEAGLSVCVYESLTSHGWAGCSSSPGPYKGTLGAWPEPMPGGWSASCRVPCSEPYRQGKAREWGAVGEGLHSKGR